MLNPNDLWRRKSFTTPTLHKTSQCSKKKPRDVFDESFCSNSGLIMCLVKEELSARYSKESIDLLTCKL